jgi:hypothetical protein
MEIVGREATRNPFAVRERGEMPLAAVIPRRNRLAIGVTRR